MEVTDEIRSRDLCQQAEWLVPSVRRPRSRDSAASLPQRAQVIYPIARHIDTSKRYGEKFTLILDSAVHNSYIRMMARPRKFNRDAALRKAIETFWAKGFAATSTDELLAAMRIGRQSLYNAFGDKRQLYLEALRTYQQRSTGVPMARLRKPTSPIEGIRDMLVGLAPEDNATRLLGCMGVGWTFASSGRRLQLAELRLKVAPVLYECS